jgi:hypothetical protein
MNFGRSKRIRVSHMKRSMSQFPIPFPRSLFDLFLITLVILLVCQFASIFSSFTFAIFLLVFFLGSGPTIGAQIKYFSFQWFYCPTSPTWFWPLNFLVPVVQLFAKNTYFRPLYEHRVVSLNTALWALHTPILSQCLNIQQLTSNKTYIYNLNHVEFIQSHSKISRRDIDAEQAIRPNLQNLQLEYS